VRWYHDGDRASNSEQTFTVKRQALQGVTDQIHYRWRAEYRGMRVDQAKRLKELEQENARLKKLVADQALDISILEEAAWGNF
jgi:hypothetical protein